MRLESIQPLSPKRATRQQHRGTLTSAIPIPSKPMTSIFSHAELFPVRASGSQTISPLIFSDLEKVQLLVSSQCALAGTSNRRSTLAAPATGLPPAAQPAGGNSGKLGVADCVLEVENLALKLRMISKSSAYPTTVSPVQVAMTGSGVRIPTPTLSSRTSTMTLRYRCMPAWTLPVLPSGTKRRRLPRTNPSAGRTQICRDNWKRDVNARRS